MTDCAFKPVTATGIAESDNMAAIFGKRISLYRLAGPRANLVDAICNVERADSTFLHYRGLESG